MSGWYSQFCRDWCPILNKSKQELQVALKKEGLRVSFPDPKSGGKNYFYITILLNVNFSCFYTLKKLE